MKTVFFMGAIQEPQFPDWETSADNYENIQQAVDACALAGGGTVIVGEGQWETGPIRMYSNICLHFKRGAVVNFSSQQNDYLPAVFTRWEGTECYNYSPLIYAHNCENIAVCGEGMLYGSGEAWWGWKKLQEAGSNALYDAAAAGLPVEKRVFGTEEAALRPSFLQLVDCRQVLIEGITLNDGPQWTIHPVYCQDVVIRNVHVHTTGPNTDGLNPDSCKNVVIEDSDFCTGDDCIAINSGLNEDGWRVGKSCENIEIRRCRMTGGHGGVVENVRFENIRIDEVSHEALQINMFYEFSTVMPKTEVPSVFRNISFTNVQGSEAKVGLMLKGLPEQKLEDIILQDVELTAQEAMICSDVSGLVMERVVLKDK